MNACLKFRINTRNIRDDGTLINYCYTRDPYDTWRGAAGDGCPDTSNGGVLRCESGSCMFWIVCGAEITYSLARITGPFTCGFLSLGKSGSFWRRL